ncbi:MAG: hypothetical protein COB51_02730 [Moraxellaceae bacterium]|nr:MAG: hypothetical protein COB51_02730 [Moraxellaceae bacterium]
MKIISNIVALSLIGLFFFSSAQGAPHAPDHSGQEGRQIKSLSGKDIHQLKQGKGWGLAKVAELNGLPGPAHVLMLKKEISLSLDQEAKIQALYDEMKKKAIPLGYRLVALEKELNESFANRTITKERLTQQLDLISNVRKELRYVHLVTHVMTPQILTTQQISEYNRLRGYYKIDPCKNIPRGHDVVMWKKHNDCSR